MSEMVFPEGDWVYLKLRPYMQFSVRNKHVWKLSLKYAEPFQVIQRVEEVSYKLSLPDTSKIHQVFHVSLLKKHVGLTEKVTSILP